MGAESEVLQDVYSFSLVYAGAYELSEDFDEILFGAGCDDATLVTRDGFLIADFGREAPSFREALLSAIEGIERASLPIRLIRVEPL